jgi:opine dehydrogenase
LKPNTNRKQEKKMKQHYNFAILGAGNGGMALAGQIASQGHSVNLFEGIEPSTAFLQLSREKEIFLQGDVTASGKLNRVTTDMAEAVSGVEIILVVVPSFAHEPLFKRLVPLLKDGHKVVLIPGNYGSLLLKKMLRDSVAERVISISETASLPYACRTVAYNRVMIHKAKKSLKLATCPQKETGEMVNIMNRALDIFVPGKNVLEVSLDNFNGILHPLPALLNIGSIENNSASFRHYMDGISPMVSDLMIRMDQERLAVGQAYSLELSPTMNQLKDYYGDNDSENIFAYVNSADSPYKEIVGHNVRSRYITEDIPYLILPIVELGEKAGVETPVSKLCVDRACQLHEQDYTGSGHSLDKLGVDSMSKDQLLDYIS